MNNALLNEAELLSQHLTDVVWEWIPDLDIDGDDTGMGRLATVEFDTGGQPELHDVVVGDDLRNLFFPAPDDRQFITAAPRLVRGLLAEVERLNALVQALEAKGE